MAKVPGYTQGQLASAIFSPPGVDPSGEILANANLQSMNQQAGALLNSQRAGTEMSAQSINTRNAITDQSLGALGNDIYVAREYAAQAQAHAQAQAQAKLAALETHRANLNNKMEISAAMVDAGYGLDNILQDTIATGKGDPGSMPDKYKAAAEKYRAQVLAKEGIAGNQDRVAGVTEAVNSIIQGHLQKLTDMGGHLDSENAGQNTMDALQLSVTNAGKYDPSGAALAVSLKNIASQKANLTLVKGEAEANKTAKDAINKAATNYVLAQVNQQDADGNYTAKPEDFKRARQTVEHMMNVETQDPQAAKELEDLRGQKRQMLDQMKAIHATDPKAAIADESYKKLDEIDAQIKEVQGRLWKPAEGPFTAEQADAVRGEISKVQAAQLRQQDTIGKKQTIQVQHDIIQITGDTNLSNDDPRLIPASQKAITSLQETRAQILKQPVTEHTDAQLRAINSAIDTQQAQINAAKSYARQQASDLRREENDAKRDAREIERGIKADAKEKAAAIKQAERDKHNLWLERRNSPEGQEALAKMKEAIDAVDGHPRGGIPKENISDPERLRRIHTAMDLVYKNRDIISEPGKGKSEYFSSKVAYLNDAARVLLTKANAPAFLSPEFFSSKEVAKDPAEMILKALNPTGDAKVDHEVRESYAKQLKADITEYETQLKTKATPEVIRNVIRPVTYKKLLGIYHDD